MNKIKTGVQNFSPCEKSPTATRHLAGSLMMLICCISFGLVGMVFGIWLATEPTTEIFPTAYEQGASGETSFSNDVSIATSSFSLATTANNFANQTLTLPELFIGANPAVVAINTETTGRNFFGQVVTLPAAGSGFIVSANGYIVTNDHVIENASRISVMLYDGTVFPASIIGRYRAGDLAVLKIDAENLPFLTFGDSDGLMVGEQVAAIGNPLGELANSMTVGHISGLDREITIGRITLNMIQTDASVNRGNSGGPLMNLRGQVIGVVTARADGATVEGLGFAIPSNIAAEIVARLIEERPAVHQNQNPIQGSMPNFILPGMMDENFMEYFRRFIEDSGFIQGEDGRWRHPQLGDWNFVIP